MANYSLYKSIIKIKINISLYNKLYDMYSLLQQTSTTDIYVSATVSNPCNIAGLTAIVYTFPFTLAGTRLSPTRTTLLVSLQPCTPSLSL